MTWLEINKKNLLHNIDQFTRIAPKSEIWPVVKSNAYGHGVKEVIKILDKSRIGGFMFVSLEEALLARNLTKKPMMVLSYFAKERSALSIAATRKISLPVYDLDTINYLDELGKKLKKKFLVNIKIDTGTSRLGFRVEESENAIQQIKKKKFLKINSIFTHYAESESADKKFTEQQFKKFSNISAKYSDIQIHSACSAASINFPFAQQDIIRLGISLYGLWPSLTTKNRGTKLKVNLKPVLSWRTKVIQVKKIKAGETIGYNRSYKCQKNCQIVVLPVGYNEGYSRMFSNKAKVLIKGKKYPVRGNICMNLTMVELPANIQIKQGEVATLLGKDHNMEITANDLAIWSNTINYEVTTRINSLIKRIIV